MDVVFDIASADTDEATVSPDTLTFTNANWNTPQTITLTGEDDSILDGSQDTTITISIDDDQSNDAFDATADKTVTVTTTDDDSVGITLDKSSLNLAENGGSDTFTLTLNTTPDDEVTVPLTTTDNCTLSTTSVVLNSMSGVEVTVTAIDDNIDNATDRTCTINTGDPTTADINYAYLVATDVANVSVTITDDDVASANLTSSSRISEPVNLPSTADTSDKAVNLFDFTISDGGISDGLSTDVSQIVLHTSGSADFAKVTWKLNGNDGLSIVGTYNSTKNIITFSGLTISIADGADGIYTINGYFNNTSNLIENETYILSIDGDTDLILDDAKTQMGTTTAVDNGIGAKVDIMATKLIFTTQPAPISIEKDVETTFTTVPVVQAIDANGNIDTDFAESVSLSSSDGVFTNGEVKASNGVATFTALTLTSSSSSSSITITANDEDGVGTDLSTVDSSEIIVTINQAPTVSGAEANQAVNDNATIQPFANIVLADGDANNISVSISLNNDDYGTLSASSVGTGTVASVQSTLRDIIFTPADNRKPVGGTETTTLTITLNDGTVNSTPDSSTTVVSTSVNDRPTNITLSSTSVGQSGGVNAIVGSLTTTDVDVSDTFTYALVGGDGSTNNSSFNINSANLRANNSNTLGAGTYNIRIQTTDASSATYSKAFTITITDDIAPTLLTLSPADDATAVAIDSDLVITLSKDVTKGSGSIVLKKASDDATVETEKEFSKNFVTIYPKTTLDFNTEYYVQIEASAIKDRAGGNDYAGILDKTTWNFTTGDAFTVSKTTASVNESGTTDTFTVVLNAQPETDVVFNITSADTDEATVDLATLTFTSANWNTAQTITITGIDDSSVDGSQNTTVTISVGLNIDEAFQGLANKTVTVTTTDNDSVGITLDKTSLILAENGGSDTFTLTLNTIPTHDVIVPLTTTENCTLSTTSVILDSTAGVEVTVTAIDDNIDNATDRTCTINTGDPTTADINYAYLVATDVANVSVTITDDDVAQKPTPPVVVVPEVIPDKVVEEVKEEEEEAVEPTPEPIVEPTPEPTPVVPSEPIKIATCTSALSSAELEKPIYDEVTTLYIATFGRAPDSDGLCYWINESGMDIEGIAKSFFDQEETKEKYPEGYNNYDFIVSIYQQLFKRDPDQAGGDYWLAELNNNNIDRSQFILAMINGAKGDDALILGNKLSVGSEFIKTGSNDLEKAEDIMQNVTSDATNKKATIDEITKLYIATFNRVPDAEGLDYWINQSGLSLEQIAISFFDQDETKNTYPEGYTNYDFIIAIYNNIFNRDPDEAGLLYWKNELSNGNIDRSQFILAIINGATGEDAILLASKSSAGV